MEDPGGLARFRIGDRAPKSGIRHVISTCRPHYSKKGPSESSEFLILPFGSTMKRVPLTWCCSSANRFLLGDSGDLIQGGPEILNNQYDPTCSLLASQPGNRQRCSFLSSAASSHPVSKRVVTGEKSNASKPCGVGWGDLAGCSKQWARRLSR